MTAIYEGIAEELDVKANVGVIDEYTKLTIMDMSKKVLEHLAKKYSNIKKEVGAVMGGKILDYEAKDILNAGKAEGISIGREEGIGIGREQGLEEGQIMGTIRTARRYHVADSEVLKQLMEEFDLDEEKAQEYLKEGIGTSSKEV